MKRLKKNISVIIAIICSIALFYGILFYFSFFQGNVYVDDNIVSSKYKVDDDFKSVYTSKVNFDDLPVSKISDDIKVKILGADIPSDSIYEKSLRYYIPLNLVSAQVNYNTIKENDKIVLENGVNTIVFYNNSCFLNGQVYDLRGKLLNKNNELCISISDIEYLFNLTATFDFDNKEISLLEELDNSKIGISEIPTNGKAALLRLEDFSAGYGALNAENQLKYKCIGKLLKDNAIKFHVAWVPRFISPSNNIDNDLLTNNTLENVGFIDTLDYFINCGTEIGLHGYTHQYGDDTSLNGIELSYKYNNSEEDTRKVIENAIDSAASLNIPCSFFESPHYKASRKQKKIIEEYFQFLYEPKNILEYNELEKHDDNLYIPTPLDYVANLDTSKIEKGLKSPRPNELASLFYHPALELQFINVSISESKIQVDYDTSSPLCKIVKSIKDNNYVPIYVTDFKK